MVMDIKVNSAAQEGQTEFLQLLIAAKAIVQQEVSIPAKVAACNAESSVWSLE